MGDGCMLCPENHICRGGSRPVACPAGTQAPFLSANASQCAPCPLNMVSRAGEYCSFCPAGSYCVRDANETMNETIYNTTTRLPTSVFIADCRANYYSQADGLGCRRCGEGKESPAAS